VLGKGGAAAVILKKSDGFWYYTQIAATLALFALSEPGAGAGAITARGAVGERFFSRPMTSAIDALPREAPTCRLPREKR